VNSTKGNNPEILTRSGLKWIISDILSFKCAMDFLSSTNRERRGGEEDEAISL
jgi:hypothetical protein